jgi:hypothetical protein
LLLHAYRHDQNVHRQRPYLPHLHRDEYRGMSLELRDLIEALQRSVEELQTEVSELRLGLDPARLAAFLRIVPSAAVADSGVFETWRADRMPEPTDEEYQFCYNFVIESALRLQRLGAVPAPRGWGTWAPCSAKIQGRARAAYRCVEADGLCVASVTSQVVRPGSRIAFRSSRARPLFRPRNPRRAGVPRISRPRFRAIARRCSRNGDRP